MIMTNKNYNKLVFETFIKKMRKAHKNKMTVFIQQILFKEYFGSSFRIILMVFYVLNFLRQWLLRHVAVQMTSLLQWPDGLGGLPGVTPHTKFDFFSILDGLSFVCFSNLKNWWNNEMGTFNSIPCRARPLLSYWIAVSVTRNDSKRKKYTQRNSEKNK